MNRIEKKAFRKEFQDYYLHSSIPSMKWGLAVNLLLFILFASVNELFFHGREEQLFYLRFGVVVPFFIISIVVLFIRRLRPWLSPIFIVINTFLCAAIFMVGISAHVGVKGYEYYFSWVMLMSIGLYTFFRLRFSILVLLGSLQVIAYILAILFNHSFRENSFMALNDLFFIISAAVLGFFIAFTFQRLNMKNFLHQKALDNQYKKLVLELNERIRIEQELKKASDQKMIMMKEIHHRVKNNLAIVISMLSLQQRQISDPVLQRAILDIQMRIRSMALIHEHLYRSEDLDRITLHEYLRALTSIILSSCSSPKIHLETEFDQLEVSIETALPIGLITNELLTNAIKYAFPKERGGTIRISLKAEDGMISLTIADNGIGLPDSFNLEEQTTLGIFIVKLLTEQLSGKLSIDSGEGTSVTLTFPAIPIRKPFTN